MEENTALEHEHEVKKKHLVEEIRMLEFWKKNKRFCYKNHSY